MCQPYNWGKLGQMLGNIREATDNSYMKLPSINHIRHKMCAIEVFKCFNGISPPEYKEYFKRKSTRGNDHSLLLPKVKSEAGRKPFGSLGAKILKKLPNNTKTACKDF